ncbi:MAG: YccF domain-containing protein [Coriobacteriia bacterium]|nr:YccF domain-containing protein [Coriobacteriia bacterium]MCL2537251.1 YccF domain-containing protein [Coriobacteriia bacterium]
MRTLGNIIWLVCGGWLLWLTWMFFGVLWCITIVGIPIGMQCFKLASVSLWPFNKQVDLGGGAPSFIINVVWIVLTGWVLALEHLILGAIFCITIVGIPFGLQHFKLAKLSLMPFGAQVSRI